MIQSGRFVFLLAAILSFASCDENAILDGAPDNSGVDASAVDASGESDAGGDSVADPCRGAPTNACGTCAVLPAKPGDACGPAGYLWSCAGDGSFICAFTGDAGVPNTEDACPGVPRNACGGCNALPVTPGESCGPEGFGWQCTSSNVVVCGYAFARPINFTATTNDVAKVALSWTSPPGFSPTGFVVLRDGVDFETVAVAQTTLDDRTASPGGAAAPASFTASQGTLTTGVSLAWQNSTNYGGQAHEYHVIATYGTNRSPVSAPATGARAVPDITGYEYSRDDGVTWVPLALGMTSAVDTNAPATTLQAAASARAELGQSIVVLSLPTFGAIPVSYRLRATTAIGPGDESRTGGYRAIGKINSVQWQRSAGAIDAAYADLSGVTGTLWYATPGSALDSTRFYRAVARTDLGLSVTTAGASAAANLYSSVSGGQGHACGIRSSDSKVLCWGYNYSGEAPPGPTAATFKQISANHAHTCGIRDDDKRVCWGRNTSNQAPTGPSADSFKQVSAGAEEFTCGIRSDDKVVCWGNNSYGRAPAGPSADSFKQVSAGYEHACAIRLADDKLVCWGNNRFGEAAPGPSVDSFKSITTTYHRTCGVRTDDKVVCMGQNNAGQSPPGPSTDAFKQVSAGSQLTCALRIADNKMVCWGNNVAQTFETSPAETFAQIDARGVPCGIHADGSLVCWAREQSALPPPNQTMKRIQSSDNGICAIQSDNRVVCWGGDDRQQAPAGPSTDGFKELSMSFQHTCGIRATDEKLACWGFNGQGQAPPGPSVDSFKAVATGFNHTCAIRTADEKVLCWGPDYFGEAPAGPSVDSYKSLAAGANHTCGVRTSDSKLVCWGSNSAGQAPAPANAFKSVVGGYEHTCAIREADSKVECWGSSSQGQKNAPNIAFKQLGAGFYHTCGIRASDDKIVCWGATVAGRPTVAAPSLETFAEIGTGDANCGLRLSDHKPLCFASRLSLTP